MLTNPLRDRFGIVARLEFYTAEDLSPIVERSGRLLKAESMAATVRRDRAACARDAADRQPAAAPDARLRGGARERQLAPAARTKPWQCSTWIASAST